MKLLLDENLSRRVVPFLQEAYPGSSQVALLGLETATDQQVWDYARRDGYVIVSKDSDFYDLSLLQGTPPQVIWIKTGNASKAAITDYCFPITTGFCRCCCKSTWPASNATEGLPLIARREQAGNGRADEYSIVSP